jgi:hypothetical protein
MSRDLGIYLEARNQGIALGVKAIRDQVVTVEAGIKHLLQNTGADGSQDAEHLYKALKLAIKLLEGLADRIQYGNDL